MKVNIRDDDSVRYFIIINIFNLALFKFKNQYTDRALINEYESKLKTVLKINKYINPDTIMKAR